jgi:hypothetical protein
MESRYFQIEGSEIMRIFLVRVAGILVMTLGIGVEGALGGQQQLITNGNFSAGLAGWTVVNQAGSAPETGVYVQPGSVNTSPITGLPMPTTTGEVAVADSTGVSTSVLLQQFSVPAVPIISATLSFDLYIGNFDGNFATPNTLDFTVLPNQQVRIDLLTSTSSDFSVNVLQNVFLTTGTPLIYPNYEAFSIDVTSTIASLAGSDALFRVADTNNLGFLTAGIQDVSLIIQTVPEPSSLILAAIGGIGLVISVQLGFIQKSPVRSASAAHNAVGLAGRSLAGRIHRLPT